MSLIEIGGKIIVTQSTMRGYVKGDVGRVAARGLDSKSFFIDFTPSENPRLEEDVQGILETDEFELYKDTPFEELGLGDRIRIGHTQEGSFRTGETGIILETNPTSRTVLVDFDLLEATPLDTLGLVWVDDGVTLVEQRAGDVNVDHRTVAQPKNPYDHTQALLTAMSDMPQSSVTRGDKIMVLKDDLPAYGRGDIGIVKAVHDTGLAVDFNHCGNSKVLGLGIWTVWNGNWELYKEPVSGPLKLEPGDVIRVDHDAESFYTNPFYQKGDWGTVNVVAEDNLFVDFTQLNNPKVYGNGRWWVEVGHGITLIRKFKDVATPTVSPLERFMGKNIQTRRNARAKLTQQLASGVIASIERNSLYGAFGKQKALIASQNQDFGTMGGVEAQEQAVNTRFLKVMEKLQTNLLCQGVAEEFEKAETQDEPKVQPLLRHLSDFPFPARMDLGAFAHLDLEEIMRGLQCEFKAPVPPKAPTVQVSDPKYLRISMHVEPPTGLTGNHLMMIPEDD
jgi:hypothetical protein